MSQTESVTSDEAVVRHYLTALNNGQVLEALNTFSMDARLHDWAGRERHGIREIAAAFAGREHPVKVDIEQLEHRGDEVAVRLRVTLSGTDEPREYRSVFRVQRARIRSLVISPLAVGRTARSRAGLSA